jgi:short subunit dehydrogenase-like uncharacterized protein
MADWMIYGASGYTGKLVAEEAVKRGHKPLLAGRSASKLKPLADRLGLEYVAVSLDDTAALEKAVSRVELVYHAAGPFIHTSAPMVNACLAVGAHYLDITGEIPVFQNLFRQNEAAREKGIALISGVGFDVVPSDCLIKYVADQLPDATHVDVVFDALGSSGGGANVSAGTTKSALEGLPIIGGLARRNGELTSLTLGSGAKKFPFPGGEKMAMPIPWGDLEVGYRTSGIPNITTFMAFPPAMIYTTRVLGSAVRNLLKVKFIRDAAGKLVDRMLPGPSEKARETGRSMIYAQVRNAKGETRQAWLETLEGYQLTMVLAPMAVERLLDGSIKGATTPALAFGADFILEVPGTKRWDTLPEVTS